MSLFENEVIFEGESFVKLKLIADFRPNEPFSQSIKITTCVPFDEVVISIGF